MTTAQVMMFGLAFSLSVVAVGLRMSGYLNRTLGLVLVWVGASGMLATVVWWRWPLSLLEASLATIAVLAVLAATLAWLLLARSRETLFDGGDDLELDIAVVRNATVAIAAFSGARGGAIESKAFEYCEIVGPAVLSMHHCYINSCGIDGAFEDVAWIAPNDKRQGCVVTVRCHFYQCTFTGVGFAVHPDDLEDLRQQFIFTHSAAPQPPTASEQPPPSSRGSS